MGTTDGGATNASASFTWQDIESWAAAGVIDPGAPWRIWNHVATMPRRVDESDAIAIPALAIPALATTGRRLSLTTVAAYLGGLMVLLAYTVFAGLSWVALGDGLRLTLSTVSLTIVLGIALALRRAGAETASGLLATAAAGIIPLVVYSFQKATGLWPDAPDRAWYESFSREVEPAWVWMEAVSIGATLVLLRWLRFPLLTLPITYWTWYLSLDLARSVFPGDDRTWWSVGDQTASLLVGAAMLGVGIALQRRATRDYSLWLYLYGHVTILASLTSLTLVYDIALGWLIFPVVYVAVIVGSVWLQRTIFLVFGSLGLFLYLCYLSSVVFDGALGFTFALALIGILVVLASVWFQRRGEELISTRVGRLGTA